MAAPQWRWIDPNGFEYTGDLETLRSRLESGRLPRTTMVWVAALDGWLPAHEVPELGGTGAEPGLAPGAPLPAFTVEDDAPTIQQNPIPEAPPGADVWAPTPEPIPAPILAPVKKPRSTAMMLLIGVAGLGALGAMGALGAWVATRSSAPTEPQASAAPSASAASSAPAAPSEPSCSAGTAQKLASEVVGRVALDVTGVGSDQLAVAFAESKSKARVLVLDAKSLRVGRETELASKKSIAGVVVEDGGKKLALDVDAHGFEQPRTVAADTPFSIGTTSAGIARRVGAHRAETVWPGGKGDSTIPRVDSLTGVGHFVALRRGGLAGKIYGGWLDPNGEKKTDLIAPELDASSVGTPSAAVGRDGVLLLVAAKSASDAEWQVFGGRAGPGEVPGRLARLALGDPGTSRISPCATAWQGGSFLVQWTEGAEGAHGVKLRVVDAKLEPRGKPVDASPRGSDAGQGALWSDGQNVVSLFLVATGQAHELWAAPISCK